jgi:hypothetical protein
VGTQDRLDRARVDPTILAREPLRDPGRLGLALDLLEVLLAPPAVHRHDRDEAAARDQTDDEQPPLELRHQPGSIGRGPAYTRPR